MPWWIPLAASAAGSVISSVMGNRQQNQTRDRYDRRTAMVNRQLSQIGAQGREASQEYLDRLRTFDPMAAATQAAEAQYQTALPLIQRQVNRLRGSQVGHGRLRTGYGMQDQDELLERNYANLNQSMIARAMQAAEMQAQANRELGAYGEGARNLYIDATLGRERSRYEQEMANQASQRGMYGNLLAAGIYGAANWPR
jgi:hypothetical protein